VVDDAEEDAAEDNASDSEGAGRGAGGCSCVDVEVVDVFFVDITYDVCGECIYI
jgi:hypothetical protein